MSVAFLFPGQGSQRPGMGADLYERFPEARARFDEADAVLGFKLTEVMFAEGEAAAEELKQTAVTQPALYVHSLAAFAVLAERGHAPDMAAGHGLGEYSALAACGALAFADGLRAVRRRGELMAQAGEVRPGATAAVPGLDAPTPAPVRAVRRRGELMAQAGEVRPGAMAAVLGLDAATLERVCAEASRENDVAVPANYNDPGQIVISGDRPAVARAGEAAEAAGAKRVV